MTFRSFLTILSTVLFAAAAWAGPAEDAKTAKDLLGKGDLEGALKAYAAAAKAESPQRDQYRAQWQTLRQVISLRESLTKETNPEKWQKMARGLRNYYFANDLYTQALDLDTRANDKFKTPDTAASLAQTLLQLDKNAEAEKVLDGIDAAKRTADVEVTRAIAKVRQGKKDEAKAIGEKIKMPAEVDVNLLFNMACLKARLGETDAAAALLTQAFENIAPSQLPKVKEAAKKDKDLAGSVATPAFEKAFKTESKVKESGCSGGSSCGSCSKAGSCASSKGGSCATENKDAPKK